MAWPTPKIIYRPKIFTVTTSNNKIDFEETAGVNLAATLTAGRYTLAGMAAEVKRALNAAGASTYTVTYNLTGASINKFTITSNGTGGGGILNLEWATGPNTATSAKTLLGFSNSDDTGALTYTSDTAAPASVTLTFHEDLRGPIPELTLDGAEAIASAGVKQVLSRRVDNIYRFNVNFTPESDFESWWDFMEQAALRGVHFDFYPDSAEATFVNFTLAEKRFGPSGPEKPFQFFDFSVRFREVLPEEPINSPGGRGSRMKTLLNRQQWI